MSKNILLSSAPTARIQLGNKGAIELDTANVGGKKSIKIQIYSNDDTIQKEIENVVGDIKSEIEDANANIHNSMSDVESNIEREYDFKTEQLEQKTETIQTALGIAAPVLITFFVFAYLAIKSFNNRKYKEALLSKGFSPEEIEKRDNSGFFSSNEEDMKSFEQKRHLKYAIVLGSLGLSAIMGYTMGRFIYFCGFLCLFLGAGYYYFAKKGL